MKTLGAKRSYLKTRLAISMVKRDISESIANMLIGAVINWVAVWIMFDVSAYFVTASTIVFFVLSFVRSLLIRRLFRRLE